MCVLGGGVVDLQVPDKGSHFIGSQERASPSGRLGRSSSACISHSSLWNALAHTSLAEAHRTQMGTVHPSSCFCLELMLCRLNPVWRLSELDPRAPST